MNEVNLNAWSAGIDKGLSPVGSSTNASSKNTRAESDSVQFSQLPDLSAADAAVEEEFAQLRANLEEDAKSPSYPPLETIDRLAHMFAVNLKGSEEN